MIILRYPSWAEDKKGKTVFMPFDYRIFLFRMQDFTGNWRRKNKKMIGKLNQSSTKTYFPVWQNPNPYEDICLNHRDSWLGRPMFSQLSTCGFDFCQTEKPVLVEDFKCLLFALKTIFLFPGFEFPVKQTVENRFHLKYYLRESDYRMIPFK